MGSVVHPACCCHSGNAKEGMENKIIPQGRDSPMIGYKYQANKNRSKVQQSDHAPVSPQIPLQNRFAALQSSPYVAASRFIIQAAKHTKVTRTYVGSLDAHTKQRQIREHLVNIGVNPEDIDDVTVVKSSYTNSAAFCISVSSKAATEVTRDCSNWPDGVKVGPYREPKYNKQKKNGNQNKKNTHGNSNRRFNNYEEWMRSNGLSY